MRSSPLKFRYFLSLIVLLCAGAAQIDPASADSDTGKIKVSAGSLTVETQIKLPRNARLAVALDSNGQVLQVFNADGREIQPCTPCTLSIAAVLGKHCDDLAAC